MARYDYKCQDCGYTAEIESPIREPLPIVECEECNIEMVKVIYATPAVFRGDGWGATKR